MITTVPWFSYIIKHFEDIGVNCTGMTTPLGRLPWLFQLNRVLPPLYLHYCPYYNCVQAWFLYETACSAGQELGSAQLWISVPSSVRAQRSSCWMRPTWGRYFGKPEVKISTYTGSFLPNSQSEWRVCTTRMTLLIHSELTGWIWFTNVLPGLEKILKIEEISVKIYILGFSWKIRQFGNIWPKFQLRNDCPLLAGHACGNLPQSPPFPVVFLIPTLLHSWMSPSWPL